MLTSLIEAASSSAALTSWGHFGGPGGGFGWLFLLVPLFWIGVVALIVSLAARRRRRFWAANGGRPGFGGAWGGAPWAGAAGPGFAGRWGAADPTADAWKTLAERFAQGDIDEVEYRARLEVLRANRPDPGPAGK